MLVLAFAPEEIGFPYFEKTFHFNHNCPRDRVATDSGKQGKQGK